MCIRDRFIALHFVNAEYNTTINDTFEMTNMIQKILELVRLEMGIEDVYKRQV